MILFELFSNTVQFQADDMQEKVLHYTWPLTTNHWKPRVRKKKSFFCYFYYYALRDALRCDFWVSVTSFWGALFILWKKFQASYFSFFFSCSLSPLWQKTEKSLLHIQSSLSSWTSKKKWKAEQNRELLNHQSSTIHHCTSVSWIHAYISRTFSEGQNFFMILMLVCSTSWYKVFALCVDGGALIWNADSI